MKVDRNHPAQAQIAALPRTCEQLAFFYLAVDDILAEYGLTLALMDLQGPSGAPLVEVYALDDDGNPDTSTIISLLWFGWERVESSNPTTRYATSANLMGAPMSVEEFLAQ